MLELKNVSFEVSGSRSKILDRISHVFESGTLTVMTGPNGSGKSTLAEIMMGIRKPTVGKIILDGVDVTEQDITARAKAGVSLSFQQPVKFKGLTVFELINIAKNELISPEEAGKYLKKVGLDPSMYLSREVNDKLSGGELKRIEIATVLARDAKVMIFDEPEAGIDLWSFSELTRTLQNLHRKNSDKILIVISHQERILKIADEILILEGGKMSKKGSFDQMLPFIVEGKSL